MPEFLSNEFFTLIQAFEEKYTQNFEIETEMICHSSESPWDQFQNLLSSDKKKKNKINFIQAIQICYRNLQNYNQIEVKKLKQENKNIAKQLELEKQNLQKQSEDILKEHQEFKHKMSNWCQQKLTKISNLCMMTPFEPMYCLAKIEKYLHTIKNKYTNNNELDVITTRFSMHSQGLMLQYVFLKIEYQYKHYLEVSEINQIRYYHFQLLFELVNFLFILTILHFCFLRIFTLLDMRSQNPTPTITRNSQDSNIWKFTCESKYSLTISDSETKEIDKKKKQSIKKNCDMQLLNPKNAIISSDKKDQRDCIQNLAQHSEEKNTQRNQIYEELEVMEILEDNDSSPKILKSSNIIVYDQKIPFESFRQNSDTIYKNKVIQTKNINKLPVFGEPDQKFQSCPQAITNSIELKSPTFKTSPEQKSDLNLIKNNIQKENIVQNPEYDKKMKQEIKQIRFTDEQFQDSAKSCQKNDFQNLHQLIDEILDVSQEDEKKNNFSKFENFIKNINTSSQNQLKKKRNNSFSVFNDNQLRQYKSQAIIPIKNNQNSLDMDYKRQDLKVNQKIQPKKKIFLQINQKQITAPTINLNSINKLVLKQKSQHNLKIKNIENCDPNLQQI